MDFPVLDWAVVAGGSLTVSGHVGSAPGQALFAGARVELFASDADPSGYGEGSSYIGFLTTDASGNVRGSVPAGVLVVGDEIAATATDAANNTSEFGGWRVVRPLNVVKRAFFLDGTPVADASVLPKGTLVRFMLYVSNPGPAVPDVSLQDALDPSFAFTAGSLRFTNAPASCADITCTPAEEGAILAAATAGTVGTEAVGDDVVGVAGTIVHAGNQVVANQALDLATLKVWAVVFTVRMQ
jgi:hypothetical protein